MRLTRELCEEGCYAFIFLEDETLQGHSRYKPIQCSKCWHNTPKKTVSKSLHRSLSENNAVCFQFCDIIALPVHYKLM